ncbi:MAG: lipid-A-disaccharide synthase, partial [Victivallaceae bacterium]|nr:lipid-A-disaccharide synthase [Victivallaceae bacterium]
MSEIRNIWIIAGEASGDLYGAALARELRKIAAERGEQLNISGMGGEKMRSADIDIRVDSSELGVIGVVEVLRNIFTFVAIYFKLLRAARKERPGAVVLIDYPGFNLAFALALKFSHIKVIWYVCPHLWVWGKWRLPVLARICSKMLVIFPFEVEVFAKTKLNAEFVGHPLLDIVEARRDPAIRRNPNDFLLLPGSRTMEITRLLIPMLETASSLKHRHPELVFHLSAPREKIAVACKKIYDKYREDHTGIPPVSITTGDTGYWLQKAGTGLASSGTVTVESAVAGLPLVVGYKLNWVTILLASLVVRLYRGFFTMVNIIANREVFEE